MNQVGHRIQRSDEQMGNNKHLSSVGKMQCAHIRCVDSARKFLTPNVFSRSALISLSGDLCVAEREVRTTAMVRQPVS